MRCNCFTSLTKRLKEANKEWENVYLDTIFTMSGESIPVVRCNYSILQKNKKKLKNTSIPIRANYCPFCGDKIAKKKGPLED